MREQTLFRPLFLRLLKMARALFLSPTLSISISTALSLSLSLYPFLSGSVDQLITVSHRTAITTTAIVTSRRALLAAGSTRLPASRDHRLPPRAAHCALRHPRAPSPSLQTSASPPSLGHLALPPSGDLVGSSLSFFLALATLLCAIDPPLDSPPFPYPTVSPLYPSLPLPGPALGDYGKSTCLTLLQRSLSGLQISRHSWY